MFSKLMKYDMRYGMRIWAIISAVLGIATIVFSPIMRFCAEYMERDNYSVFPIYSTIMFFAAFISIVIFSLSQYGLYIPLYLRFYKHLYTDEGYLTFTLPVKRSSILLSKTLSTFILGTMYAIVIIVCAAFMALVIPPAEAGEIFNLSIYKGISELFKDAQESGYIGWIILYIVEYILLLFAACFFNQVLIQVCVTMGSIIAKKYKLLASIGVYFGVNLILSFIARIITLCAQISVTGMGLDFLKNFTVTQGLTSIAIIFLGIISAVVAMGFAIYFTTLNLLERKLNLA